MDKDYVLSGLGAKVYITEPGSAVTSADQMTGFRNWPEIGFTMSTFGQGEADGNGWEIQGFGIKKAKPFKVTWNKRVEATYTFFKELMLLAGGDEDHVVDVYTKSPNPSGWTDQKGLKFTAIVSDLGYSDIDPEKAQEFTVTFTITGAITEWAGTVS